MYTLNGDSFLKKAYQLLRRLQSVQLEHIQYTVECPAAGQYWHCDNGVGVTLSHGEERLVGPGCRGGIEKVLVGRHQVSWVTQHLRYQPHWDSTYRLQHL